MDQMDTNKAPFLKRIIGFFIDFVIFGGLYALILWKFPKLLQFTIYSGTGMFYMVSLGLVVIPAIYLTGTWSLLGGTVGMLCLGLRVVEVQTSRKPMLFIALWRYLIFLLSWFSFFVGFLWAAFDSRRQTWSDKLANTVVVTRGEVGFPVSGATGDDISRWKTGKVLVIGALLVMVLVNVLLQCEEPFDPEAAKWIAADTNPVPDAENGYLYVIGFGADKGVSPVAYGREKIHYTNNRTKEIYETMDSYTQYLSEVEPAGDSYQVPEDKALEPFTDSLIVFGSDYDLPGFLRKNHSRIDSLWSRYDYFYPRYQAIAELERFHNPIFMDVFVPVPIIMTLVKYHRIVLVHACDQILRGNPAEGAANIALSLRVGRKMLVKSDDLINKLVGIIMVSMSEKALEHVLNFDGPIAPELADLVNNIPASSREETSFLKPMIGEFKNGCATVICFTTSNKPLRDLKLTVDDIEGANPPFVKANQILNHTYKWLSAIIDRSEMTPSEYYRTLGTLKSPEIPFWHWINNPGGSYASLSKSSADYSHYLIGALNLENRRRLLQTALIIKQRNIPKAGIPSLLKEVVSTLGDAYAEAPMKWDANTSMISFTNLRDDAEPSEYSLLIK